MRTVAEPIEGDWVRIEPAAEPGITVGGVPATPDNVQKADVRVDLHGDAGRAYVVEHVLGPLGLCGVTAAHVTGTADAWDFARPEHRFAYARQTGPDRVVGHPDGLPNPAIATEIAAVGIDTVGTPTRRTVAEPVRVSNEHGSVTLSPCEPGTGVHFDVTLREQTFSATVDPVGDTPRALIRAVTNSQTPYLTDSPHEGVIHSIGDLVADIPVLGGFTDLAVEADLGDAYHQLTVGATQKAHDDGLVVEH